MKLIQIILSIMLLSLFFSACSRNISNDKDAHVIFRDGQIFLLLKGKRKAMKHDPISIINDDLIDDSLLLQIPTLEDGTIEGNKISAKEGYYKYLGNILINKDTLKVSLQINNTDDNKVVPELYNGIYHLIR